MKKEREKERLKEIQGQSMVRKSSRSSEKISRIEMGKKEAEAQRILWGLGAKVRIAEITLEKMDRRLCQRNTEISFLFSRRVY